jgi:hypothetical protein
MQVIQSEHIRSIDRYNRPAEVSCLLIRIRDISDTAIQDRLTGPNCYGSVSLEADTEVACYHEGKFASYLYQL